MDPASGPCTSQPCGSSPCCSGIQATGRRGHDANPPEMILVPTFPLIKDISYTETNTRYLPETQVRFGCSSAPFAAFHRSSRRSVDVVGEADRSDPERLAGATYPGRGR